MIFASQILFAILVALILLHYVVSVPFLVWIRNWRRPELADEDCPKSAVILALRGPDPFLADTVRALLNQNHPNFDVRVVVDSLDDPAWAVVEQVIAESGATNIQMEPLTERLHTCSLKIASVVQAAKKLDDSYGAVVMVDADAVPPSNWLRELVAPLVDPQVGATNGNRWYMPDDSRWGSLVRYFWNAGAVVPMYLYGIPWGGSMAVRGEIMRNEEYRQLVSSYITEDQVSARYLRKNKMRIVQVPSLFLVNREACTVSGLVNFLQRQSRAATIHPANWIVVSHVFYTSLSIFATVGLLVAALVLQNWIAVAWLAGGYAAYHLSLLVLAMMLEFSIRPIIRARNESTAWITWGKAIRFLPAMSLTMAVYFYGLTSAVFTRTHRWRGILYSFERGGRIKILEDMPYEMPNEELEEGMSV